ncbi:MAG: DUF433 domain-containing protein [Anaerolineae bacterium]|nr:DUF433 domain-containing protein [Anaerolineae bacterium]
MLPSSTTIDVPLREDEHGVIRVGGTRVTLDTVIADYKRGATPEEIVDHFSVLKLVDVYYVIGYYLENQAQVDAYIQHEAEEAERLRREWEAEHPPTLTREILEARLAAKHQQSEE